MFSIYLTKESSGKSFVNFGGYYRELVKPNSRLMVIKTSNRDSWGVKFDRPTFGNELFHLGKGEALFNPAYPWIHIPNEDFNKFLDPFNYSYKKLGLSCQEKHKECRFDVPCDELKKTTRDFMLSLRLNDIVDG